MSGPTTVGLAREGIAMSLPEALRTHGFTMDGVLTTVGPTALAALGRGQTLPARHALSAASDSTLGSLIRLFLLGESVPTQDLPPELADSGLVERIEETDGELVRALVHVQPYPTDAGDQYVVSDFPVAQLLAAGDLPGADHVVGVGGASVTLATITPRDRVRTTWDLGTGCGVQALLAAAHSDVVIATDRSERALGMAAATAELSGVEFQLRAGSLFEPVTGERFELIVANPPFVISPQARFTYRESPLQADDLTAEVVSKAAEHLQADGIAVVLGNWLVMTDQPWHERVASWVPQDCQCWVVQREVLSLNEYVELWLQDAGDQAGPDRERRYLEWLNYLEELGASGVGFGWVVIRRSTPSWLVAEDLADAERLPTGVEVMEQLRHYTALHDATAAELLAATPQWVSSAQIHTTTQPSTGQPVEILATGTWRPAEPLDPGLVEVLNGQGTLGDRIDAVADGRGYDWDDLAAATLLAVRRLIGAGLIQLD